MNKNNGHNEIWKSVTAPKPQPGPETPVTPLKPIPAPGTWQTKVHYFRTINGLFESAETYLTKDEYAALLESMQDALVFRLAAASQHLPPHTAQELAAAAMKALCPETKTVVLWDRTQPRVFTGGIDFAAADEKPAACGEPEGMPYQAGEKWA